MRIDYRLVSALVILSACHEQKDLPDGGDASVCDSVSCGGPVDAGPGNGDASTPAGWTTLNSGTTGNLNAVWGSGADDVYVVGDAGLVLHSVDRGKTWTPQTSGTTGPLTCIWGSSASDVFVGGPSEVVLHGDGSGTWVQQALPIGSGQMLGIGGGGPNDIYAAAYGLYWSTAPGSWTGGNGLPSPMTAASGLWASSASDIYLVGWAPNPPGSQGTIAHGDGQSWGNQKVGGAVLSAVWGSGPNDVFAVGDGEEILHTNDHGTTWITQSDGINPRPDLLGVWGSGPNDVYAVGVGGTLLHTSDDGTDWTPLDSGTTNNLRGVWGGSAGDVYLVGAQGTIVHGHD